MPIPDFEAIMLPLLKNVEDQKEHSLTETAEYISDFFHLAEEEKKERLPYARKTTIISERIKQARTYLQKAGLLRVTRSGYSKITERGLGVLKKNPKKIDVRFLERVRTPPICIKCGENLKWEKTGLWRCPNSGVRYCVAPLVKPKVKCKAWVSGCYRENEARKRINDLVVEKDFQDLIEMLGSSSVLLNDSENTRVREYVISRLRRIKDKGAIMSLVKHLKGESSRHVTETLVKIGKPAVKILIQALTDQNNEIKLGAIKTLGIIGDRRAVEPLIKTLTANRDSGVKSAAVTVLGEMRDRRAVEPLIKALTNQSSDNEVTRALIKALEILGDKRAIEPLTQLYIKASKAKSHRLRTFKNEPMFDFIKEGSDDELQNFDDIVLDAISKVGGQSARDSAWERERCYPEY